MVLAKSEDLLPEGIEFDTLVENFEEMDEISFPRIRFKQGKFFFSDDPEDKGVEEFEAVILYYGRQNTYWEGNYDPGNIVPPECFSVDGVTGSKPRNEDGCFGACKTCEYNKFGSGVGKGKACRNQMKLYVHVLGTTVPMSLFLAPTSLGAFTQNYIMLKVTQKGHSYYKVVTKFKAYQKQNETYFRVNFEVASVFKGDEATKVKELRGYWIDAFKNDRSRLDSSVGGNDKEETPSSTRKVEPRKPVSVSSSNEIVEDEDEDEPPF
jgi:hypothetical protein